MKYIEGNKRVERKENKENSIKRARKRFKKENKKNLNKVDKKRMKARRDNRLQKIEDDNEFLNTGTD